MKSLGLCLSVLLVSVLPLSAQLSVEVTLDQSQFLQGEAVPAIVRITNRSGQTLALGTEPDWLFFTVESKEGGVVEKLAEVPVFGEFELESSKVAVKRVDIAPYFTFSTVGRYSVMATLRVKSWNQDITSPPKGFDIIEGSRIWEQEVGIPVTNAPPEVRRYILQQANYLKGQIRLYLRVIDGYGRPLKVVAIGPMVSFGRPEPQVDRLSNLHVLYQNGPGAFSYTVYSPNGELTTRQTLDFTSSRPRLRSDADGNISVAGGVRRVTARDIPPPKSDDEEEEAKASPPSDVPVKPGNTNDLKAPKN
jgi:hypothetical protein